MINTEGKDYRLNDRLGMQIAAHWAKLGYAVSFSVSPVPGDTRTRFYQIRSDMRDGQPTRRLAVKPGAGK